jgi:outer membrane receptor protein involved in Fe transport
MACQQTNTDTRGSWEVKRGINLVGRTSTTAFTTTDLFARYDFNDTTQVTFNLNNVFDKMPIVVNTVTGQYVNANINQQSTLGRYFAVGLRTRF